MAASKLVMTFLFLKEYYNTCIYQNQRILQYIKYNKGIFTLITYTFLLGVEFEAKQRHMSW